MFLLDLCSGFGGASEAARQRDWQVIRIDNDPRVHPSVIADIKAIPFAPFPVDLIWVSPPCTFYSRFSQPGLFPSEPEPDHTLWRCAERLISEWQPRHWVIENVRGASYFHGPPAYRFGPYYLWTDLFLPQIICTWRKKHNICSGRDPLRSARRGYIPYAIAEAVTIAAEEQR